MTTLNLLTDNGFKSISDITNTYIYNNNFKLTKISYINRFENFYFPCVKISLTTGMTFTSRTTQRFKGLIFSESEIKNDLEVELISDYKIGDYIYTSFINKDLFKVSEDNFINKIIINKSLTKEFYELDIKFKEKISNKNSYIRPNVNLSVDSNFYKFLAISLVRGKLNISDNYISFKFNKDKSTHKRMKEDLISFFEFNDLYYEISEYNKYYYINYSDDTLIKYVEKFKKEDYNSLNNIFNNKYQSLFLLYLYTITKNTYYLSNKTYLFFKTLAYNNKLVISVVKNPINSNHNYSLKSSLILEEMEIYREEPEVIYLDEGYLTKIINIESINLKGDAELLPEYLLVC